MSGLGSFTFRWNHPGEEVYVTGTFDDWGKTVKLEKDVEGFLKTVHTLPLGEKVYYKFVVDGNWTTDHTAPSENDGHYNTNNVLQLPATLASSTRHATSTEPSSNVFAGGQSTNPDTSHIPGAFPETPSSETPGNRARDYSALRGSANDAQQAFGVAPIPASSGIGNPVSLAPGDRVPHPSTLPENTVSSAVRDDTTLTREQPEEHSFGVAPIPASSGMGNPIHLAPGEAVPHPNTLTSSTVQSSVRTDPESYEKSDAAPQLGPVVTPDHEREARGGMFGLPESRANLIPESSLPMGAGDGNDTEADPGYIIQSAHPQSTTAELAAQVPREPRGVPQVLDDDLGESHERQATRTDPSGSAISADSSNDSQRTAEGEEHGKGAEGIMGMVGGGLAAAGAAVAGAAYAAKDKAVAATGFGQSTGGGASGYRGISSDIQRSIDEMNAPRGEHAASGVPQPVVESLERAHQSPEAAANPEAVAEKETVERELLGKVRSIDGTDELPARGMAPVRVPAPVLESIPKSREAPEAAANLEAVTEKQAMESELLQKVSSVESKGDPAPTGASATRIPDVVARSIQRSHESPEAAANPEAVTEKEAVERELRQEISPVEARGQPAPTAASSSRVPEVVAQSIQRSHESPEAAANPEAVAEKEAVERELRQEISPVEARGQPAPTAASSSRVPEVVAQSIQRSHEPPEAAANPEAVAEKEAVERELRQEVSPVEARGQPAPTGASAIRIPDVVAQSIKRSHEAPEAATINQEAIAEKQAVENELLHSPRFTAAVVEPVPNATGASFAPTTAVPEVVAESIQRAHESPEAAANPEAVQEKSATERELLRAVKPTDEASEPAPTLTAALSPTAPSAQPTLSSGRDALAGSMMSSVAGPKDVLDLPTTLASSGLNAPKEAPARSVATEASQIVHESPMGGDMSRDVSPTTALPATTSQTTPQVTTGVASGTAPRVSQAPPSDQRIAPAKSTNIASSAPSTPQKPTQSPTLTPQKPPPAASTPQSIVAAQRAASAAQRDVSAASAQEASARKAVSTGDRRSVSGTPSSVGSSGSPSSGAKDGETGRKKRHSFFGKLKEKFSSK